VALSKTIFITKKVRSFR